MPANNYSSIDLVLNCCQSDASLLLSNKIKPKLLAYSEHFFYTEDVEELVEVLNFQLNIESISISGKLQYLHNKSFRGLACRKYKIVDLDSEGSLDWKHYISSRIKNLKAEDLMIKSVLTAKASDSVESVIEKMQDHNTGSLLITCDRDNLLGIFTERDVNRKCLIPNFFKSPVKSFMTENPKTVLSTSLFQETYETFKDAHFRHLPIVDENHKLVGILSMRDLISCWSRLLNFQKQEITNKYEKTMSVVVHDLRSPIYAIRSINELLNQKQEAPEDYIANEFPQLIEESCASMAQLIDELLNVSQIRQGHIELKLVDSSLKEIFEKVLKSFKPSADAKKIEFVLELADNLETISLDRRKIVQVIQNLVSNAIKYSDQNSKVKFRLYEENDNQVFEVIDHGQGIAKEEIGKIFDEMCKISSQPTDNEASTGLGLSITKKLVESHGGSISAESEAYKETCFRVKLPVIRENPAKLVA